MKVKTEQLRDGNHFSLTERMEGIMELHINQGALIISTHIREGGLEWEGIIFYQEAE